MSRTPKKPTLTSRVSALEQAEARAWKAIEALADKQLQIDASLDRMIDVQEQMIAVQKRMILAQKQLGEDVDKRIRDLVSAIGELIRTQGNRPHE